MQLNENQDAYDINQVREKQCIDWLNFQKIPVSKLIDLTSLIGVINGVLIIAQSGLFVIIFHQLIIELQPLQQLITELILLGLVFTLRSCCSYYFSIIGLRAAEQVKRSVREQLLNAFSSLEPSFCKLQQSGALAATTSEHIEALERYFTRYLPQQMISLALPPIIIVAVMPVSWVVGCIFLLTGPLVVLFMSFIGMGAASASRKQFLAMARMSGYFLDRLQGLTTLKLFAQVEAELETIKQVSASFREKTMDVLRIAFLSSAILEFFTAIAVASVAVYVGLGLLGLINFGSVASITLREALFVLLLAPEFFNPLKQLAAYYHDKADAVGAADNILKVLESTQQNSVLSIGYIVAKPSTEVGSLEKNDFCIELQNVSKVYQQKEVIKALSIQIKTGEKIALVGASGAGKTTVFNLLLGFEQPTNGLVLVNGKKASQQNTSNNITWVGQQATIFYATIKDNISLLDTKLSDQQINYAADLAGVTEFSQHLDKGLLTLVGEKGYGLSGGQVQRIVLARTFIKSAPIVLLDEPTAHLDLLTKTKLLSAIDQLFEDKTLIIASHDPMVISTMDRVINLS